MTSNCESLWSFVKACCFLGFDNAFLGKIFICLNHLSNDCSVVAMDFINVKLSSLLIG